MSNVDEDQIYKLLNEARRLPYGDLHTSMLEEAVRIADSLRDENLQFSTRMELLNSAGFSGMNDRLFGALAWLLPRFEAEPERFQQHRYLLLWGLKNTLISVGSFSQISLEQFESMVQQMIRLYKQAGYSTRTAHFVRHSHARKIGDTKLAIETFETYQSQPRDGMAHCYACEISNIASYYAFLEEFEKAVDVAEPCLAERQTCAHIPHTTYGTVLRPLAMLGKYEEGDRYQKKGYEMIRGNSAFLDAVAEHMAYLVHRQKKPHRSEHDAATYPLGIGCRQSMQ